MDKETALKLIALNNDFYRANAESFSRSRHSGWPGWERVCAKVGIPKGVLDVACGNARFKAFLDERFGDDAIEYLGIDACPDLVPANCKASFRKVDLLAEHFNGGSLSEAVEATPCGLVACFGFMHHVPTREARFALLDFLIGKVAPGGFLAVSFWQFARDDHLLSKARETTRCGTQSLVLSLDADDYLVGWNEVPGVYRYCHSFTDEEVGSFAEYLSEKATVIDRFRADGRTGELNGYLVVKRPGLPK